MDRIRAPVDLLSPDSPDDPAALSWAASADESDLVHTHEFDEEGNQIPVVQIPLSDLISGSSPSSSFRTFSTAFSDVGFLSRSADLQLVQPDAIRKASDWTTEAHSRPLAPPITPASCPSAPKQAKTATLDAAQAQLAVSAVYTSILSASRATSSPATSLAALSGKGCLDLDPVLSNGPDRLNTMH